MPIQHGEEKDWAGLDRLPALLAACDQRWGLKRGVRFPNQSPLGLSVFFVSYLVLRRQNVVGSQSPFWRDTLQHTYQRRHAEIKVPSLVGEEYTSMHHEKGLR
jgi:hypothetical protein